MRVVREMATAPDIYKVGDREKAERGKLSFRAKQLTILVGGFFET